MRIMAANIIKVKMWAYMQNRLTNAQRYLVNAKTGTNPTNPNGNSKRYP